MTDLFRMIIVASMTLMRVYLQLFDRKKSLQSAKAVFRIIERESKIDPLSEKGLRLEKLNGDIKFEHVYFSYPNKPQIEILKGFNFEIKRGQTNILVGSSGIF